MKKQNRVLLSSSIAAICAAIALPALAVKDSPFSAVPSYLEQLTTTTKVSQTTTSTTENSTEEIPANSYSGTRSQTRARIVITEESEEQCNTENTQNSEDNGKIVSGGSKPRITIVLDNSASMGKLDRMSKTKQALHAITSKYDDKFDWNYITFYDTTEGSGQCVERVTHGYTDQDGKNVVTLQKPFFNKFTNGKNIWQYIDKTCEYGQTPTLVSYVVAFNNMYDNIENGGSFCDSSPNDISSFIIVASDGDANTEAWSQTEDGKGLYGVVKKKNTNLWGNPETYMWDGSPCSGGNSACAAFFLAGLNDNSLMIARPYISSLLAWKNTGLRDILELENRPFPLAAYTRNNTDNGWYNKYGAPDFDWNHLPEQYMYFAPTIDISGKYTYLNTDILTKQQEATIKGDCTYTEQSAFGMGNYNFSSSTKLCKLSNTPVMHNGKQLLQGMEYFSDKLYNKDLKPNLAGKQKIQTITIGYEGGLSQNGREWLKQAARVDSGLGLGNGYFGITDSNIDEITNVLGKITDNIYKSCSNNTSATTTDTSSSNNQTAISSLTPNNNPSEFSIGPLQPLEANKSPNIVIRDSDAEPDTENTIKQERLRTTSVAAPANISSQSIDVSEYPAQNRISQVTTDKDGNTVIEEVEKELCKGLSTDGGCQNQVGLMSTLSLNTANWSSLLKFQQIYTVEAPFNKFPFKDSKKYSCSLIEGSETSSNPNGRGKWLCTNSFDELNDKQGTANFPSPYKIVVSQENGKGTLLDNSYFEAFGFNKDDGGDVEFEKGFLPWISRAGSGENADVEIEEAVASANIPNRLVAQYRNRVVDKNFSKERNMADVIDASPITLSAAKKLNADNKNIDRAKYLVMGANDGMLYVYQRAGNITNPYELKFTYMPYQMPREKDETLAQTLPNTIARASYGEAENQHIYGVNGGISYMTTATVSDGEKNTRNQQTLLLANLGQGGRGVFSLNAHGKSATANVDSSANIGWEKSITDAANWEAKNGDEEINLGYTISNPVLAYTQNAWGTDKVKDKDGNETELKYAKATEGLMRVSAFVANGFPTGAKCPQAEQSSADPANQNDPNASQTQNQGQNNSECDATARDNQDAAPTLYIFDALGINFNLADNLARREGTKAGELIKKITVSDYTPNQYAINALGSPVVVDLDFDGIADVAYAGDYNGDLYRFDLRGDNKTWNAKKIFHGTNPITAAPAVYRPSEFNGNKLIVLFGTGSDIYKEDRSATEAQQRFYGIYDDLLDQKPTVLEESDLQERNFITKANKERSLPDVAKDEVKNGWYIPLAAGGESVGNGLTASSERVVSQPVVVLDGVFFTTRKYHFQDASSETSTSYATNPPASSDETCSAWEANGKKYIKLLGYRDENGQVVAIDSKYIDTVTYTDTTLNVEVVEEKLNEQAAAELGWGAAASSIAEPQLCPASNTNTNNNCTIIKKGSCSKETQKREFVYEVTEPKVTRKCGKEGDSSTEQTTTTTELAITTGSSYLMGVNVFTGGNLTNAAVKFRPEYDATSGKNSSEGDGAVSGVYYNSIASAPSVLAVHQALDTVKNTDQNGAILSGEAEVMTLNGNAFDGGAKLKTNVQNNKCLSGQDWAIYLSTSGTADGGSGNLQQKSLQVKNCGGAFLRASIREIKLNRK